MPNKQLYTVSITGGGSAQEIAKALKGAADKLLYAQDKEQDAQVGEISIEILEVCPYHEWDTQD